MFSLEKQTGTWTHIELQKAVQMGYKITDIYEQHHFWKTSTTLFADYIKTFFDIKQDASEMVEDEDGIPRKKNPGLAQLAKLMINSPTGKWGFNPSKQKSSKIITSHAEFFEYLLGDYTDVELNIINNDCCLANFNDKDEYTEHKTSNVYIAAYITGYSRMKLYEEALQPLGRRVLYMDTDSVVYKTELENGVGIPMDTTGTIGLWTSEAPPNDYFTEFVSSGPKSYCLKSHSGKADISKSKGFYLHYGNSKIYNFENLKKQVLAKALDEPIEHLTLHKGELVMRRHNFSIECFKNDGKKIRMVYDKRIIVPPSENETVYEIDTIPHGFEN